MDISTLENERRRAILEGGELRINGGWNIAEGKGGSPNTPTPEWDKGWPGRGTKPKPEDRPNIPTKLAHHMFTEPTQGDLINEVINNPELNESDYERILGPDYKEQIQEYLLRQQQALNNEMMISQIGVGYPHTNVEIRTGTDGYGKTYNRVLPNWGGSRIGNIRLKTP